MNKNSCRFCVLESKTKKALREHENNEHSPRWNNGKIHVSGGDQIILILKSSYKSWEKYHKSHSKNTDISFKDGGKRLEQWEKENGIEFVIENDNVVSFKEVKRKMVMGLIQI